MCLYGGGGKRVKPAEKKRLEFSKKLIADIRSLLWVVTVGGILLAFYCVHKNYTGSLPWIAAMVGLPWTAHGTVCGFYLNLAKSDHSSASGEGITFAAAQANGFVENQEDDGSWESPAI